jgi:uncharacterized protein with NRDE domain
MCLIALAINVSRDFPLIIAANRDEFYERPSLRAHHWTDAPGVMGGRDVTAGGTWLAISCAGRFAAVTNLRGAASKTRSRGHLVKDFVLSGAPVSSPASYAGFNLITGEVGKAATLISNADHVAIEWREGVYAVGNDPPNVASAKVTRAVEAMRAIVDVPHSRETLQHDLMRFLQSADAFVKTDRYGTRASTIVLASREEISLFEQTFPDGGSVALQCPRVTR